MTEPRLTDRDRRKWASWRRYCLAHARGRAFGRSVEAAADQIEAMADRCPEAYVGWSAGKDSTALVHLVRVEMGIEGRILSVKDDLDFPDEEDYVRRLAGGWGLSSSLDVVHPPFSLLEWWRENAPTAELGEDIHGRSAAFSKAAFYDVVAEYAASLGRPGVYLGLRASESRGRALNRYKRGGIYTREDGGVVCQPLALWSDADVYAYLFSREVEILPLYQCCADAEEVGRIRKSWWLPGASATRGQGVWLRRYYPSLWRKLLEVWPQARAVG